MGNGKTDFGGSGKDGPHPAYFLDNSIKTPVYLAAVIELFKNLSF
jgi:hypothetical protein